MKRFLFIALMALTFGANAQLSTNTTSKTITGADTITHTSVGSKVRGFQYTYTETSGTTAGTIKLFGTINGVTWVELGSTTLTDVNTGQSLTVTSAPSAGTLYKSYRWINTNTSAATGSVVATYIRRSDE